MIVNLSKNKNFTIQSISGGKVTVNSSDGNLDRQEYRQKYNLEKKSCRSILLSLKTLQPQQGKT